MSVWTCRYNNSCVLVLTTRYVFKKELKSVSIYRQKSSLEKSDVSTYKKFICSEKKRNYLVSTNNWLTSTIFFSTLSTGVLSIFRDTLKEELKGLCKVAGLSGTTGFFNPPSSPPDDDDSKEVLGAGVGLGGLFLSNVPYTNSTDPRKLGSGLFAKFGLLITGSGLVVAAGDTILSGCRHLKN